jgi:hypothetical protein
MSHLDVAHRLEALAPLRASALALAAGLALSATAARAQAPAAAPSTSPAGVAAAGASESATTIVVLPTPAPPRSHRELAGHLFLPSHLILDPFSVTSFGSYFGVGSGQAIGPVFDPGPPPAITPDSKWYGYTGLAQQFDLNIRFFEYLSMRAFLGAGAYQGTGSGSALVIGTNVRLFGDLELKGSLPLGKHVRLALAAGARYGPTFNVLILDGLVNAINACRADPANCTVDPGSFLQESETLTWNATLSAAWAPWPWLGLVANVEYLNPRKTGKASLSQNGLRLAGSVEFDAKPLVSWLPLGVNFVYDVVGPLGTDGVTTTQNTGFGLFYTGSRDLALGVEVNWQQGRLQSNLVSETTLAWVDFRYYW